MTALIINPGSGPVDGASETEAQANIQVFVADLHLEGVNAVRLPDRDRDGRFGFLLWREVAGIGRYVTVDMPGIPLEQVRWRTGLDPWQFPRLYVADSSWLWKFALTAAGGRLKTEDEVEED